MTRIPKLDQLANQPQLDLSFDRLRPLPEPNPTSSMGIATIGGVSKISDSTLRISIGATSGAQRQHDRGSVVTERGLWRHASAPQKLNNGLQFDRAINNAVSGMNIERRASRHR